MNDQDAPHGTGSARDFLPDDESLPLLRTIHPSAILRADDASREHECAEFVADLKRIADQLRELNR